MKTIHITAFMGSLFIGSSDYAFYKYRNFKIYMLRFPRSYLRKIAKKYGLPEGGDKDVQIKALWDDPRRLTVNMRWKS